MVDQHWQEWQHEYLLNKGDTCTRKYNDKQWIAIIWHQAQAYGARSRNRSRGIHRHSPLQKRSLIMEMWPWLCSPLVEWHIAALPAFFNCVRSPCWAIGSGADGQRRRGSGGVPLRESKLFLSFCDHKQHPPLTTHMHSGAITLSDKGEGLSKTLSQLDSLLFSPNPQHIFVTMTIGGTL